MQHHNLNSPTFQFIATWFDGVKSSTYFGVTSEPFSISKSPMSGSGFLRVFAEAMVLQSVEDLSDDQGPAADPSPAPTAKASVEAKVAPKKKPQGKATSAASAAEAKKPKGKSKGKGSKDPKAKAKSVAKQPVMKRPSALRKPSDGPKIARCHYSNGSYGFKVDGKQVLTVTRRQLRTAVCIMIIHQFYKLGNWFYIKSPEHLLQIFVPKSQWTLWNICWVAAICDPWPQRRCSRDHCGN